MARKTKKFAASHQFGSKKKRCRVKQASPARETAAPAQTPTSSETKMRIFSRPNRNEQPIQGVPAAKNRLVDFSCVAELFPVLLCPNCHVPDTLSLTESDSKQGQSFLWSVSCLNCGTVQSTNTSVQLESGKFAINSQIAAAMATSGIGFSQVKMFFGTLGLPGPMSHGTFKKKQKDVHQAAFGATEKHLVEARAYVRKVYIEDFGSAVNADGSVDISVSYDGSWQKRGYSSKTGCGAVIDIITGLILDYVVLSRYCRVCEKTPGKEHKCQKNHEGSPQSMETHGAVLLWERSIEKTHFRYVQMLCDGDAKSIAAVNNAAPYGEDVEKLDCVNHVSKRLGTALRNVVSKRTAMGKSIQGRGKLTVDRIKKLTNYYGKAIKDNNQDLEKMRMAVWASYYHSISTDATPQHKYCPRHRFCHVHNTNVEENPEHGICPFVQNSWCFYQRATLEERNPEQHKHPLPEDVAEAIKPIYERLCSEELLKRCIGGKTQNSNESYHSVIWKLIPKERWGKLDTVETAVSQAVIRYNEGSRQVERLLHELKLQIPQTTSKFVAKRNKKRVMDSKRAQIDKSAAKRQRIEVARLKQRQEWEEQEGVTYSAGAF